MQAHEGFRADRVNAFVADVAVDDLGEIISPDSVDVVTLVSAAMNAIVLEFMCYVRCCIVFLANVFLIMCYSITLLLNLWKQIWRCVWK